jgi:hypothetical protein
MTYLMYEQKSEILILLLRLYCLDAANPIHNRQIWLGLAALFLVQLL